MKKTAAIILSVLMIIGITNIGAYALTANPEEMSLESFNEESLMIEKGMSSDFLSEYTSATEELSDEYNEDIEINTALFPDPAWRAFVQQNADKDKNGWLSKKEIQDVVEMTVPNQGIRDLKGVEVFTNLIWLNVSENMLTSLDISKNTRLVVLLCYTNQLSELDLSQNVNLERLFCYFNQLKTLDVSNNPKLTLLVCAYNELKTLDLRNNSKLEDFFCQNNKLTTVFVAEDHNLEQFVCMDNALTALNLPKPVSYRFDVSTQTVSVPLKYADGKYYVYISGDIYSPENVLTLSAGTVNANYIYFDSEETVPDTLTYTYIASVDEQGNPVNQYEVELIIEKNIEINEANFPDSYWRNYVAENYDIDENGVLSINETHMVTNINLPGRAITSLQGIEYFSNLSSLYCYNNQITELDVSQNTKLLLLYCYENQISALDVSNNTKLRNLACYGNLLTELDVRKNTELLTLTCRNNQIETLDLMQNAALTYLNCRNNRLTMLDISKNTALETLDCSNNGLLALDISNCTRLINFNYNNQIANVVAIDAVEEPGVDGCVYIYMGEMFMPDRVSNLSAGLLVEKDEDDDADEDEDYEYLHYIIFWYIEDVPSIITYDYDIGDGRLMSVTLHIEKQKA